MGAMGAIRTLRILVDVKGAKDLQGISGNLQRTGANLTKFVTLPLLGVGAAAVVMAADAEKSAAKLEAAFANMGKTSGKSLQQLQDEAKTLGETTTFDDEGIMEAQAALLTFGAVGGESFDRALQGALDYAAATGTDLVTATKTFGKALADPEKGIARLTRAGIIFTDSQKEQVAALVAAGDKVGAQELILSHIEERYRGVNDALASTDAGKAAQAFEDLGNAGEDIGAVFLPMLATLAQGLSTVARWFTDLPGPVQGFIVTFLGILAAVGPVLFVVGKLMSGFGLLKLAILNIPTALGFLDLAFSKIGLAFGALKALVLANPFIALAAAVIAIAALIILNWDKISAFLKEVWSRIIVGVQAFGRMFQGVFEGLARMVEHIWGGILGIIKGAINGVIDVINAFFGFLNGFQIGIPEINVGPVHVGGGVIDPFNIGMIPRLASGGIITQPTLALLGEAGPEAVIPLDESAGGVHFHSHIEVKGEDPFIRNEDDLIRVQQRVAFLEGF